MSQESVYGARLLSAARDVLANSYSVYSSFPVGAAILSHDGEIYTGTNVENASFGLSICAERAAICNMVAAAGFRTVRAVAVVGKKNPVFPCGACLQVIAEFAPPDTPIITLTAEGAELRRLLGEYFPFAFNMGEK